MRKCKNIFLFSALLFFLLSNSTVLAEEQYKITAYIKDVGQVCFITGTVMDASGNGIYPADVTFICGSAQMTVATLPGGSYIGNPPVCATDFTVTASAHGQNPVSESGVNLGEDELLPLNLSFTTEASLEDAIRSLQILSGLDTGSVPPDRNQDSRVGLEDAIYTLQAVAELRGGSSTESIRAMRMAARAPTSMALVGAAKNVRIGKDTDGDGVDDWFQSVTTDASTAFQTAPIPSLQPVLTTPVRSGWKIYK